MFIHTYNVYIYIHICVYIYIDVLENNTHWIKVLNHPASLFLASAVFGLLGAGTVGVAVTGGIPTRPRPSVVVFRRVNSLDDHINQQTERDWGLTMYDIYIYYMDTGDSGMLLYIYYCYLMIFMDIIV
jgi:hypothetical protein